MSKEETRILIISGWVSAEEVNRLAMAAAFRSRGFAICEGDSISEQREAIHCLKLHDPEPKYVEELIKPDHNERWNQKPGGKKSKMRRPA